MGQTIELSYWLDLNSWKCRRFVRIVGDTLHALRKIRLDTSERPSKIGSQSEPTKNGGTYQVGWRRYRTKWESRHTLHQWKLEFGKTFWSKRYLAWKIGVFTFLKPSLILFTTLQIYYGPKLCSVKLNSWLGWIFCHRLWNFSLII